MNRLKILLPLQAWLILAVVLDVVDVVNFVESFKLSPKYVVFDDILLASFRLNPHSRQNLSVESTGEEHLIHW
jgi:hypothetical protein